MIEKVVENWLTKASERSYQIPFAFMLIGQGHTIVHVTRHCSLEFGKDIITRDPRGRLCAYQLKGANGGRYGKADYRSGLDQLGELVEVPVNHPSIAGLEQHDCFLVVNGEIDEEVAVSIKLQNERWTGRGFCPLMTINKGAMFAMAMEIKQYLLPTELTDVRSLLEFYLNPGDGFIDKPRFASLLAGLFTEEKKAKAEVRRLVSACALVCAIALDNFSARQNHIALIEGWTIYATTILGLVEQGRLTLKDVKAELNLAEQQIEDSLVDLYREVSLRDDIYEGNRLLDALVYKHRGTIVVGMLAELGRRSLSNPALGISLQDVDREILRLKDDLVLWGDSAVPYQLSVSFYQLPIAGRNFNAMLQAVNILSLVTQMLRSESALYFDSYHSAEDCIRIAHDESFDRKELSNTSSYSQYPLLAYCLDDRFRPAISKLWPHISQCVHLQYTPATTAGYFRWHNEDGKNLSWQYSEAGSWAQLKQAAAKLHEVGIPSVFKQLPNWLPLFFMVYPHRMTVNLLLYYKNYLLSIQS